MHVSMYILYENKPVNAFVHLCIESCIHVYVGIDVVMHVSVCEHTCACMNVFDAELMYYVCMCVSMCLHTTFVCMSTYTFVCVSTCELACVCAHLCVCERGSTHQTTHPESRPWVSRPSPEVPHGHG